MMGIYPSYYLDHGTRHEIIGTQFESTAARQAFPCVDEPAAKATFSLAIKFDEHPGETIISNMPEDHVSDNGVHYFKQTMRMSSYLIAFAFGKMVTAKTKTNDGINIGVFASSAHQKKELTFALGIAKRAIEFYEKFYQTKYPLPHSWQMALPDFSAGAMENWGLVTYRESLLLIDPKNASFSQKQLVATVITHELAHQWFGDLVTMKWWDDLWLNESFANMMMYLSIGEMEPSWKIWHLFQTMEVPMALQRDAIDGVQPVHVQVKSPQAIDSLFDPAIVYAKGARMLVMVRALLGDDVLRKGLKHYLHDHKFGNAAGNDLWDALGQASGMDVKAIMGSWLEQPGYPVVSASVKNGHVVLSQKQFFIGKGVDKGRFWQIPLESNYASVPKIMKSKALDLGSYEDLRHTAGVPFRLNDGNNSHFIVKYDQTLQKDIFEHLMNFDAVTQLQVLQDLDLLAQAGQISFAKLVPFLLKLKDSKSAIVNSKVYGILHELKNFVASDEDEKNFNALAEQLSADNIQRLGIAPKADESHDEELTRPLVLKAALIGQNKQVIQAAHDLCGKFSDDLSKLPASVRGLVLMNEVKNYNSSRLFDKLLKIYSQSQDAAYKSDICGALTSVTDVSFIKKLIKAFENAQIVKPQDLRGWFAGVLANKHGEDLAWHWIRDDWTWLNKTVGGDMEFTSYITVISRVFHTAKRLAEFKAFFMPKVKVPGLGREITMDTKIIANHAHSVAKDKQAVNQEIKAVLE